MTEIIKPIFLLGATAAGKTAVAIELHNYLPVEIISVDSALIYRKMNIGTAKPSKAEQRKAPHRLIDIIEPWEQYSVSCFIEDAKKEIADIIAHDNIPLLVGGTMMYYKALEHGITDMPSASTELRLELNNKAMKIGWKAMHDELARIDPASAIRIHPNDPQRIQRALEVWCCSGKTMTEWHQKSALSERIAAIKFGLFPDIRSILHQRIATRFAMMLTEGFIEEVEALMAIEVMNKDMPSMRCVGYRQVWSYLDGNGSLEIMKEKAVAATRQLAKRQITWMRKMQNLQLFDSSLLSTKQMVDSIVRSVGENTYRGHNV